MFSLSLRRTFNDYYLCYIVYLVSVTFGFVWCPPDVARDHLLLFSSFFPRPARARFAHELDEAGSRFSPNVARAHFAHELDGAERRFPPNVARARFAHKLDGAGRRLSAQCSSCAFRARARWR